jgi:large repetitive protein
MTDISGTNGNDTINQAVAGNTTINTGNGNDTVTIAEAANSATIINTGNGSDTVAVAEGANSTTVINTGNGNDTVVITGVSTSSTVVNVGNGNDTVLGGAGRDIIYGGNGADVLSGGAGDDIVYGGNGKDTLYGGAGNDILYGGNGSDVLIGGAGSDRIYGGNGPDIGIYALADHYKIVNGALQSLQNDVDTYIGGKGSDTIRLVFTREEYNLVSVQAALAAYKQLLATNGGSNQLTTIGAFNLTLQSWEKLQIEVVDTTTQSATRTSAATGSALSLFTDDNSQNTRTVTGVSFGTGGVATSIDPGATGTSLVATGNFGTLAIDSHGNYTYTVSPNAQSGVDTFSVTTVDGYGFITATTLSFNAVGNHAPVAVADTASVKEDTNTLAQPNPATGNVLSNDTDVDALDTHSVTTVNGTALNVGADVAGTYGTLHLDANGSYFYTLDNTKSSVQALAEGQIVTDIFTYTNSDNHGGSSASSLTVTIHGTNDAAVIGDPTVHDVTEDVAVDGSGNLTASGTIAISDVDQGQPSFQTVVTGAAGNLGSLVLAVNGGYTYTVANGAVQFLGAGDTKVDSFTVTSLDGTQNLVSFTIHGTNDVPVIGGVSTGSVTEDVGVAAGHLATGGSLTIADIDQGQSTFVPQASAAGTYGTFTLDTAGNWTYTADDGQPAIQQLGAGDSISDSFTAVSLDGTASQLVTVTINGTNDVPVIGGVSTGSVTEDVGVVAGNLVAGGALTIADIDQGQSTFVPQASAVGTYGTFTLDAAGNWSYTASDGQLAIQQLGAGDSISDSFTATSFDGTASQLVTVTINGTNDIPVIGGVSTGSVTEDLGVVAGNLATSGALTIADIDQGQSTFVPQAGAAGTYGTFTLDATGNWTYSANDGQLAIQQLGAGDSISDSFTAMSLDGTASQLVTVTIAGTNDVPVLGGVATGAVTEDVDVDGSGNLVTGGALTIAEVDQGQSSFVPQPGAAGTYGTFTLDAAGNWTYTASDGQPAIQQLGAGDTLSDSFTAVSLDGTASQLVTVTIAGTNDIPVIGGVSTGSVTEDIGVVAGNLSASGALTIADVDQGQSSFVPQGSTAGSYGTFTLDVAGDWSYTADDGQLAIQQLGAGDSISDSFTAVSLDGTASQVVTVTINGTIDSPVLTATATASGNEDTAIPLSISASDVDTNASLTFTIAGVPAGASLSAGVNNGGGSWTLTPAQLVGLTLTSDGEIQHFDLTATAINTEGVATATASGSIHLDVNPVAEPPSLAGTQTAVAVIVGTPAALTIADALTEIDADSALGTITISGVPAGVAFNHGNAGTGNTWTLNPATDLVGLTIAASSDANFTLQVVGTTNDGGNIASSAPTAIAVTVTPNAPTITQVADDVAPVTGNLANGGSTNDTTPTPRVSLTGTGVLAGDAVQLFNGITAVGSPVTLTVANIGNGFVDITLPALTNGTTYNLGAKITDGDGNTGAASANFTVIIDTTAPTVSSVVTTGTGVTAGAGDLNAGHVVTLTVNLSETVTVAGGTPTLTLNDGGTAAYQSGSGSSALVFTYTVATGQNTADLTVTGSALNGATILDGAGNAANLAGAVTNPAGTLTIDTTAPTMSSVVATGTGIIAGTGDLNAGHAVTLTVNLSEAVTVAGGTPTLTLNDGGTATYQSGSGSSALVFTYAVAAGQNTADLTVTGSALNGATILDGAGNAANLAGAVTNPAGALIIDTTAPTVAPSNFTATRAGNTWTVKVAATDNLSGVTSIQVVDTNTSFNLGTQAGASFSATATNPSQVKSGDTLTATVIDGAGNSLITTHTAPAGVAGEAINLGLTDLSADLGVVNVAIAGIPSGWNLNAGTNDGDGTWTVQTNDLGALTITTPAAFTGATVLGVTENWTNADGTTGGAYVADNVEAYAPGSPIFAWSGDDTLTGSGASDLFVFAQPIGNDTIHGFNAAADRVDLIGFASIAGFADIQANAVDDASGNAVITLGAGESITLAGVGAAALTAGNFVFDREPVTTNPGGMVIGDGALLPLGGTIDNTGTIALASAGDETDLEILVRGATLQGAGQMTLSDNGRNAIFGGDASAVLTNLDNTISGAGRLGAGALTLVNSGVILANGSNALVIDTGNNVVANSGTLEATGSGGLSVAGAVANTGILWANGGNLSIGGAVTGSGTAVIDGAATLEFAGAASTNTSFAAGTAGTLKLDQSAGFTGTVAGFAAGDALDLADIGFAAGTTLSYAADIGGTRGTLTVSDGTHTASLALLGQYAAAGFQDAADTGAGTLVTYVPPPGSASVLVAQPQH